VNASIKEDELDTVIEKSNIAPKDSINERKSSVDNERKSSEDNKKSSAYFFVKRTIDIVASLIALIVLSPILLIVILAIKFESKGEAIFSQERVGIHGKLFKMHKFRSMVVNAEELKEKLENHNQMDGPMFKIKDDPRVTKVGKFIRKTSIDELPQLVNVLKGEMTLVGPRPSLLEEVEAFEDWMKERLEVKPGLTCYWQVLGRNDIGFEDWMKLDVKYVKERSTWLDIKLIAKTFRVFFGDEHAS
jgi:exopolysaccharide biosynthesis polyprenyl glycosylphosphotransferase